MNPEPLTLPTFADPFIGWLFCCCLPSAFVIACCHAAVDALNAGRFHSPLLKFVISIPLARISTNQAHLMLHPMWLAGLLHWNGCWRGLGGVKGHGGWPRWFLYRNRKKIFGFTHKNRSDVELWRLPSYDNTGTGQHTDNFIPGLRYKENS